MIHHKREKFRDEAIATTFYVLNRVTSRALPSNTTPYQIWHSSVPNVYHLRVFGSQCWYVLPNKYVHKLDDRSRPALMLRYSTQNRDYKLWDAALTKFLFQEMLNFWNLRMLAISTPACLL